MKQLKNFLNPLLDLPTPVSISFMWNFGFMLGVLLSVQVATGFILSMGYVQSESGAFLSVVHIMRDSGGGWFNRLVHANVASLFFMSLMIHLFRGFFFGSYISKNKVWMSGSTIFVVSMATAFFGYVLPWGQMSYWGATVITNIFSALPYIGKYLVEWLWGNFSVSQPTLNRFFSIHFVLPFFLIFLVILHILFLHFLGSSNSTGLKEHMDKVEFHQEFTNKDFLFVVLVSFLVLGMISKDPMIFMDPENMNESNSMKAPVHIQPEWYFLFAYAILRSVPSKLGGVVSLILSVSVVFILPLKNLSICSGKFSPVGKIKYGVFMASFLVLTLIGSKPVEDPYFLVGKVSSFMYFISILV